MAQLKINEDVTFFLLWEFVFWSFDFLPEAHCSLPVGGSGEKKKDDFQQEDAFQWLQKCAVLAEDQSEDSAWVVDQHHKSSQKEVVGLYLLQALEDITYNTWQGHKDTRAFDLTERGAA